MQSAWSVGRSRLSLPFFAPILLLLHPVRTEATLPNEPTLRQLVAGGVLTDLRWPNFTRFQPDVARFYESNGYQLAWVRSGAATPQAQALIHVLEDAALKGLDPADYDGPRWSPSDAGPERFDLALTVSATAFYFWTRRKSVEPVPEIKEILQANV